MLSLSCFSLQGGLGLQLRFFSGNFADGAGTGLGSLSHELQPAQAPSWNRENGVSAKIDNSEVLAGSEHDGRQSSLRLNQTCHLSWQQPCFVLLRARLCRRRQFGAGTHRTRRLLAGCPWDSPSPSPPKLSAGSTPSCGRLPAELLRGSRRGLLAVDKKPEIRGGPFASLHTREKAPFP